MQFLVLGYDGDDPGALDRRMAAREAHLKGFRSGVEQGTFLYGAAMLDDEGKMIGSLILCDFPSRQDVQEEWLAREPYVLGQVWQRVVIHRAQVPSFLLEHA